METVKRMSKNLKYTPRRRLNLDATSFGPALKLAIALVLLAALALLIAFVAVPLISARIESGAPLIGGAPTVTVKQPTAAPVNPILTNEVKTVQYGEGTACRRRWSIPACTAARSCLPPA